MTFMRRSDQSEKYDARSLSENMRDLDNALKRGMKWSARKVEALYTEPMWVRLPSAPLAILAGRIQQINGPELPVSLAGALVHFVWDGPEKGARITKIQGMTSGTTAYRFTFLIAEGVV
jgi:hypothetical protein